jgi:hypothetical protein
MRWVVNSLDAIPSNVRLFSLRIPKYHLLSDVGGCLGKLGSVFSFLYADKPQQPSQDLPRSESEENIKRVLIGWMARPDSDVLGHHKEYDNDSDGNTKVTVIFKFKRVGDLECSRREIYCRR